MMIRINNKNNRSNEKVDFSGTYSRRTNLCVFVYDTPRWKRSDHHENDRECVYWSRMEYVDIEILIVVIVRQHYNILHIGERCDVFFSEYIQRFEVSHWFLCNQSQFVYSPFQSILNAFCFLCFVWLCVCVCLKRGFSISVY